MILISLILVLVSAVSLLIGGLFSEELDLIYVSIAAALAAGVFLLVGVLRGNRRPKPVRAAAPTTTSGDDAPAATWKGAGWSGNGQDALSRDEDVTTDLSGASDTPPAVQDAAPPAPAAPPAATPPAAIPPPAPAPPPAAPPTSAPAPRGGGWAPPGSSPRPASSSGTSRPAATPPPPPPPPA